MNPPTSHIKYRNNRTCTVCIWVFALLFPILLYSQGSNSFGAEQLLQIEQHLITKKIALAQLEIKEVLTDPLMDQSIKNAAMAFEVEVFVEEEKYDRAIERALELLERDSFEPEFKVRLWIQLGLVYEILQQPEKSLEYLHKAQRYYISNPRDRYYGIFLYRKSSLHRVNGQMELALPLARKARAFGEENEYHDVTGTAYFLLSSIHKNTDSIISQKYLNRSIEYFTKVEDPRGLSNMLVNLAMVKKNKGEYKEALTLVDSALNIAAYQKDLMTAESAYLAKSAIFESTGNLDSALVYYKIYDDFGLRRVIEDQRASIDDIHTDYALRQEILEREETEKRLQNLRTFNLYLWMITGLLLIAIVFLVWFRFRLKRKNNQISEQTDLIKKSNTELEAALAKKQTLLRELNHTVKNNLTLILSLVQFQLEELEDPYHKNKIEAMEKRIRTIALAHAHLSYDDIETGGRFKDLSSYIHQIRIALGVSHNREIIYEFNIATVQISIKRALPLGILVNELLTNSINHANTDGKALNIYLSVEHHNGQLELSYSDSGIAYNEASVDLGLGSFIINSMVEQLDGTMERIDQTYLISFKIK